MKLFIIITLLSTQLFMGCASQHEKMTGFELEDIIKYVEKHPYMPGPGGWDFRDEKPTPLPPYDGPIFGL